MILDFYFLACLLYIFLSVPTGSLGWREVVEVSLDLCDAVFKWKKTFPEESLHYRPHCRPVHQLEHEEMRLKAEEPRFIVLSGIVPIPLLR